MTDESPTAVAIRAIKMEGRNAALKQAIERLESVRSTRITAPEQNAVDACLAAVRELGGEG